MIRHRLCLAVFSSVAFATLLSAQPVTTDSNVAFSVSWLEQLLGFDSWEVSGVEGARFEEDVARRGTLMAATGEAFDVKVRPATRRDEFNNVPRYEIAAYHIQSLFLDQADYVVPPTVFRGFPLEVVRGWGEAELEPTYEESEEVFFVVQYWLQNVTNPPDPLDIARFEQDPAYARHMANLNVLTYLIDHKDANQGNVLMSTDPDNPRAFTVDNGVSFASDESEQGTMWRDMRVPAVPAVTVERLRTADRDALEAALLVVSQHRLEEGRFVPDALSAPINVGLGVRQRDGILQLGLTVREIRGVEARLRRLLRDVDRGRLGTF